MLICQNAKPHFCDISRHNAEKWCLHTYRRDRRKPWKVIRGICMEHLLFARNSESGENWSNGSRFSDIAIVRPSRFLLRSSQTSLSSHATESDATRWVLTFGRIGALWHTVSRQRASYVRFGFVRMSLVCKRSPGSLCRNSQWRREVNVSYRNNAARYRNSETYKRCAMQFYVG